VEKSATAGGESITGSALPLRGKQPISPVTCLPIRAKIAGRIGPSR